MNSNSNHHVVYALHSEVNFGEGVTVDGYQMPDGEFRVGIVGASLVLGFAKNWLSRRLLQRERNSLEGLHNRGFDGYCISCQVQRKQGGSTNVRTIGLDDFNVLIEYAVEKGKKKAIAISRALRKVSLLSFFRDAFELPSLTPDEQRKVFYQSYAQTIDWLAEDREETEANLLPGDDLWVAGDYSSWSKITTDN